MKDAFSETFCPSQTQTRWEAEEGHCQPHVCSCNLEEREAASNGDEFCHKKLDWLGRSKCIQGAHLKNTVLGILLLPSGCSVSGVNQVLVSLANTPRMPRQVIAVPQRIDARSEARARNLPLLHPLSIRSQSMAKFIALVCLGKQEVGFVLLC